MKEAKKSCHVVQTIHYYYVDGVKSKLPLRSNRKLSLVLSSSNPLAKTLKIALIMFTLELALVLAKLIEQNRYT